MPRWMSGISQPMRYCVTRSATIVQWKIFAAVPYCNRGVIVFRLRLRVRSRCARRQNPLLRRADENADRKDDDAAEHDLEDGLQERRIHVASADEGDRPQLEEHDDAGDRGRYPEGVRPCIG